MNELKLCPFCGCHDYSVHLQRLYYENDNYTKYKVICEDCGAGLVNLPHRNERLKRGTGG